MYVYICIHVYVYIYIYMCIHAENTCTYYIHIDGNLNHGSHEAVWACSQINHVVLRAHDLGDSQEPNGPPLPGASHSFGPMYTRSTSRIGEGYKQYSRSQKVGT